MTILDAVLTFYANVFIIAGWAGFRTFSFFEPEIFVLKLSASLAAYWIIFFLAPETTILNMLVLGGVSTAVLAKYTYYTNLLAKAHTHIQRELRKLENSFEQCEANSASELIQELSYKRKEVKSLFDFTLENKRLLEKMLIDYKRMSDAGIEAINPNIEGLVYLVNEGEAQ